MRRLLTDCIAVSVKGISYLYALFLALMGEGLENLLRIERIIRLEEAHELEGGIHSYETYFSWYFRLKFTTFWIKECSGFDHLPRSYLDEIIINGINDVCDDMVNFLDDCAVQSFSKRTASSGQRLGHLWQSVYKKLEAVAKKSKAIKATRKWRACRSRDTWDEYRACSGDKVFHRSTMRLDLRLQAYLYQETISHKKTKGKPLYSESPHSISNDYLLNKLEEIYGLTPEFIKIPYSHDNEEVEKPKDLYRQLHDIPFQCAIMRSIDFLLLGKEPSNQRELWDEFTRQAHEDLGLGREIFALALEFYTWGRESPKSRLLLSINLMAFLLPLLRIDNVQENKTLKELYNALNKWLSAGADLVNSSRKDNNVISIIRRCTHRQLQRKYAQGIKGGLNHKAIQELGAIQIDEAFSFKGVTVSQKRRLEQLSGYKLKELQMILDKQVQEPFIKNKENQKRFIKELEKHTSSQKQAEKLVQHICILANLREFLSIRNESIYKQKDQKKFYDIVLKAFAGGRIKLNQIDINNLPQKVKPIIVTRLALTNYYAVADARISKSKEEGDKTINPNGLGLGELLKQDHWNADVEGTKVRYSILLGRYDAVSFASFRLPCRCRISYFPNEKTAIENEKFATHFSRREIALPVEIYGDCDINDCGYKIYAISSVSLQRRSMRLNLIYRLLNAGSKNHQDKQFYENSIEAKLRTIINKFGDKNKKDDFVIKGLLTDGWGDLLLVFMYKKDSGIDISGLHEYLFELQQALYEDFMIDRTELIYTPHCLDYMLKDDNGNYSFSLLFRFQEDRKLERSIQGFVDALYEKRELLKFEYNITADYEVIFTPGQYDVKLRFNNISVKKESKDIYTNIIDWLSADIEDKLYNKWYRDGLSSIDKIETNIERIKYNIY